MTLRKFLLDYTAQQHRRKRRLRAAAHVAEVSGDAEATALGLQELTALLDEEAE